MKFQTCLLGLFLVLFISCGSKDEGSAATQSGGQQSVSVPAREVIGITDFSPLSAGGYHTCLLSVSGEVQCWGSGAQGQLGNNALEAAGAPVNVVENADSSTPLSGVVQITSGESHSCALTRDKEVKCWGQEYTQWSIAQSSGKPQANQDRNAPVKMPLSGMVAVSAGWSHTCALTERGALKCWGENDYGELGNGTTTNSFAPVDVLEAAGSSTPLSGVVQISVATHLSCALLSGGRVKCWGGNDYGNLGNDSTADSYTPVDVVEASGSSTPLSGVAAVSSSMSRTCALMDSGGVKCWGSGNSGGLGNGADENRKYPVDVLEGEGSSTPLSGVVQVSAGTGHVCALMDSGGVKCWGNGSAGQLGNGGNENSAFPVDVLEDQNGNTLLSDVISISVGMLQNCALTASGLVKCWGGGNNLPVAVVATEGGSDPFRAAGMWKVESVCHSDGFCKLKPDSLLALSLQGPATTPASNSTPQLRVYHLEAGDQVSLHLDSACNSTALAEGTVEAEASVLDLTVSALTARENTIYAKVGDLCSSNKIPYTYSDGAERLVLSTTSPSDVDTPIVWVNLLADGDEISLHLESGCTDAPVAEQMATGNTESLGISPLGSDGIYNIYLKQNGVCYPHGITYQLQTSS